MPPQSQWTDEYGVPVRMYGNGPGKLNDHVYALGVVWTLLRNRRKYDLIYFLMPGLQVAYGVPLGRLLGIPTVMKFSGSNDLSDALRSFIGPFEIGALRRWSKAVMVLNTAMVDEAVSAGFRREQLVWMPNPVDTEQYRPCEPREKQTLRDRLGMVADVPTAVFVGRLAPEKELPSLVAGFAVAARKNSSARLVVVGDGVMRPELEQQVKELGIADRVLFAGMRRPDEICLFLQAADIFMLTSRREGLPVSLIEAMSTGLPSVVTDLPANTQLVQDGVHGFHVPVGDSEAIGHALLRLVNDPETRFRFGIAARTVAAKFGIDSVLDTYEDLFATLVPSSKSPRTA